jgi:hypothetical protein
MTHEWTRGEYTISTDRTRLDLDVIHGFLTRSYWAEGRSRERVARSVEHSLRSAFTTRAARSASRGW